MPSWGPEPGRPPPERTPIMSVGGRERVRVWEARFQHAQDRTPGSLASDTPFYLLAASAGSGELGPEVTPGGQDS